MPSRPLSVPEFTDLMEKLSRQIDERTDQLGVLEALLVQDSVNRKFMPTLAPIIDGWFSSNFGYRIDPFTGQHSFHEGIDFPAEPGTPIVAAASGKVVTAEWHPQYGKMIEIDHGNGLVSRYAHTSQMLVKEGDLVVRGQRVATVGSTGRSTGPHLHFEVRLNGVPQNPARFLQSGELTSPVAPAEAPTASGVRRSSPLVFCRRRFADMTLQLTSFAPPRGPVPGRRADDDFEHPHPHLRQPQRAPAEAVRDRPSARSTRWSRRSPRCRTTSWRRKTAVFKERVADGEALDALLPEAFAVVREAGKRVLQMRHFDVQLIGGMVLHNGKIAEMRTGEGKTLVATLPAYLNALSGKGVHVVTVNDYLAQRDANWMGRIYRFLGLTVGVNLSQMAHDEKQVAYARRHHLRHQQRIRLRLPARQHGVTRRASACSARSPTRSSTRSTRS